MSADLFEFLIQLARDREAGAVLPLAEYQRRFPGREAEIAVEFARVLSPPAGDSAERVPLSSAEPPSTEFATHRLLERLRAHPPAEGRYRRQDQIGSGGMGVVLRVADDELRRPIALKKLRKQGERAVATFLDEAQITAQLDHPGIVPVHDLGVDPDGSPYFTMRYVKGKTLSDIFELVKAHDREWTQTRVLNVLLRVCEALAYAHSKRVIHRDLKPTNIMCGEFGETYVMDWGVARVLPRETAARAPASAQEAAPARAPSSDSGVSTTFRDATAESPGSPLLTHEGDVMGTPCYMPLEQAAGRIEELGPWSDVYAVGAILYQLLAGYAPYGDRPRARTSYEMLARVCAGPPKPVLAANRAVSGELAAICERAMARDWRERYPDMREMASDLRAYLEQRVVRAYRTGAWQELKKWCARNRLAAVFVVLFVIAAVAAGLGLWVAEKRRHEREMAELKNLRDKQGIDTLAFPYYLTVLRLEAADKFDALRHDLPALEPLDPRQAEQAREWLDHGGRQRSDPMSPESLLGYWVANCKQSLGKPSRTLEASYPGKQALAAVEERRAALEKLAARNPQEWLGCRERLDLRAVEVREAIEIQSVARFRDDLERRLFDEMCGFLDELRAFSDPRDPRALASELQAQVESSARAEPACDADARAAWEAARASIRDATACPAYRGLELRPQAGLLPLGRNPRTGLWEFAHTRSGRLPEVSAPGEWGIGADTCIILVLVPGGVVPAADGAAAVELEPFFLATRELTLGQWLRLGGPFPPSVDPERLDAADPALAEPVTDVTWDEALVVLVSSWLHLPRAAQWEHAARADCGLRGADGTVREWTRDEFQVAERGSGSARGPTAKTICSRARADGVAEDPGAREGRLQDTRWSFVGVRPARFLVP